MTPLNCHRVVLSRNPTGPVSLNMLALADMEEQQIGFVLLAFYFLFVIRTGNHFMLLIRRRRRIISDLKIRRREARTATRDDTGSNFPNVSMRTNTLICFGPVAVTSRTPFQGF